MISRISLAVLTLLVFSCAVTQKLDSRIHRELFCNILSNDVSDDVDTLLGRFGIPEEKRVEFFPNKHIPEAMDQIHTAKMSTGFVSVYSVPAINRNYLVALKLTEEFWPKNIPNYIGSTHEEIQKVFVRSSKFRNEGNRYYCDEEASDFIEFKFLEDQVIGLIAQKWVD